VLAFVGLVLTHISVNTLNDYSDYKSGIDLEVNRTPFSGGSGILVQGGMTPKQVLWFGIGTLLLAVPIGVFFVIVQGWELIPLLVVAALCVVLYTPVILKTYWPEWSPGLGLGMLPVMGAYFVQTGEYNWTLVLVSVPSFILVHNLLLINEFPDIKADRHGGRKTLPVTIGGSGASKFYSAMTILMYLWIVGCVIAGVMPVYCLLALLTLPLGIKAIRGSMHYDDMSILVPALASNVMVVLLSQLLLGIGYILGRVF
jgi:1,4-dihydroxy-2-naphthoate octaprenyltransferase